MEIDFMPLSYDAFDYNDKNYIRITGREPSGKRVCIIDSCDVYFWAILRYGISGGKIKSIQEKINSLSVKEGPRELKILKTELHDKKFLGKEVKALKIFISNYKDAGRISEKINFDGIEKIREHDVNYTTKYIIEKKLSPMQWHKISGEILSSSGEFGGIDSNLDVDLCIKAEKISLMPSKKEFAPKVLAFDIETDSFEIGGGKILMISLASGSFKKVITYKKTAKKADFIEHVKDEKEMLEKFNENVKKISPDIIVGYFSDNFDLPYIKSRAEKNKVKLTFGINSSGPKFSGGINPKCRIDGIAHIDMFKFIDNAYSQYLQSETLGLSEVAGELIGEKKLDYDFKPGEKMNEADWDSFFEYSLNDSVITYKLFSRIWPDISEFSKIMGEPLFNVSRDGMSANVENYIIHNLEKYNEIIEEKPVESIIGKRRTREKYEGAFVLQPMPKLYENIVIFDFTSYWPSIIATFNLSLSTYLGNKKEKNALEVSINSNKKEYFSKTKGFFPQMLEEIIKKRKEYKEEYKKNPSSILKARSNAFKLLANASYGYQGFFGARYYCPEASAAATAISRDFIKKVIESSRKEGFNTIYGDTDSLCFELNKKSKAQALDLLKKINSSLPGIMELELEDFYKRGIWVTTRKGEVGAKKKYALINESGKMKIRGFETVRRDWCQLARILQNNVLKKILTDGNEKSALEYTKSIVEKVKKRDIAKKELIIKTQLKKSLSSYIANTPHVTIAKKMIQSGMPVNQGMLIEYYIAESNDKKALTRDRAVLPDDKVPYDIKYYLEKQVMPAVENIFMVFNVDASKLIDEKKQKTLGEF